MQSHDCHLKWFVKNSLIRYSFDVMESRICSNCTRYVHRPSTPGKEVNGTENTVRKIAKRRQIPRHIRKFTLAQILILVKFYSIT